MYEVVTDHQVVAFGPDRMDLFDCSTGSQLATAVRTAGMWTVTAVGGSGSAEVNTRTEAVMALTEQVLTVLEGSGYSTTVPHGLLDTP